MRSTAPLWSLRFASAATALFLLACSAAGQTYTDLKNLPAPQLSPLPPDAKSALDTANTFAQQGELTEAVDWLLQFAEAGEDALISAPAMNENPPFVRNIPAPMLAHGKILQVFAKAPEVAREFRQRLAASTAANFQRLTTNGLQSSPSDSAELLEGELFSTELGDQALLLLGDQNLERGYTETARWYYLRTDARLLETHRQLRASLAFTSQHKAIPPTLAEGQIFPLESYGQTTIPLGEIWTRLFLVSIAEENVRQASEELRLLRQLFPTTQMTLGGKKFQGAPLFLELDRLLQDAKKRQEALLARSKADPSELGSLRWSSALPKVQATGEIFATQRVWPGNDAKAMRAYFPRIVDGQVVVPVEARHHSQVLSWDLDSGKPLWFFAQPRGILGRNAASLSALLGAQHLPVASDIFEGQTRNFGSWRSDFSLGSDDQIYFRLGGPASSVPTSRQAKLTGRDINQIGAISPHQQGREKRGFPLTTESTAWTFDGLPHEMNGKVYVVMRHSDGAIQQIYVACFDSSGSASTSPSGKEATPIWRKRLYSIAGLTLGTAFENANTALTASEGLLYVAAGHGVVAALRADDGKFLWCSSYDRSVTGGTVDQTPGEQVFRDGPTCYLWQDLVICMPRDFAGLFALDRFTGEVRWVLRNVACDANQLLGVKENILLVSGDVLYWIDARHGNLLTRFPAFSTEASQLSRPSSRGIGRGALGNETVYFPTRDAIHLLSTKPQKMGEQWQAETRGEWGLAELGIEGGNLLFHSQEFLLTTGDGIYAFGDAPEKPKKRFQQVAQP